MGKLELVVFYLEEDSLKYSKVIEKLLIEGWKIEECHSYSDSEDLTYKYKLRLVRDIDSI